MTNELISPSVREMPSVGNKIKLIHKNIMDVMTKYGGEVINSSYILVDGVVREAYGHYKFSKVGAVMTSLYSSQDGRCLFDVRFLGFEKERNKFNKIKNHIEEALRRNGLNIVPKNER